MLSHLFSAALLASGPETGEPGATGPEPPTQPAESPEPAVVDSSSSPSPTEPATTPKVRRFMVGLEGVGMQVPALRSPVVDIDPRFTGHTVAMGGLGAFGRWRMVPLVGLDLGVRSGSVRYRDDASDANAVVSYDLLMAEAGLNLFVARGDIGHLGLEAGGGGMFNLIRYDVGDERSSQAFGSGFVRAGVGAELLTRRVAFLFALRVYGVMTDTASAKNRGELFAGQSKRALAAAVAPLQTFVVGSLGVAYRF